MASVPVNKGDAVRSDRIVVADLPAIARAAVTIHRGSMVRVEDGYRALLRWADDTREQIDGFSREVYLECSGDPETWITELQFALHERDDRRV
jgi:effector-binding domain-containing protein